MHYKTLTRIHPICKAVSLRTTIAKQYDLGILLIKLNQR